MNERLTPLRTIDDWEDLEDCSLEDFQEALEEECEKWMDNHYIIGFHLHTLKSMIEGGWDRLDLMEVVIEDGQRFQIDGTPGPYPVNGFPDYPFLDHASPDQKRLLQKYGAKPGELDSDIAYSDLLKDCRTMQLWHHVIAVNDGTESSYDAELMRSLIEEGASIVTHFHQKGIDYIVLDGDFWRSPNMSEFVIDRDILRDIFNVLEDHIEPLYWNNIVRTKMLTARYPSQREKSLAMIKEAIAHGADVNMRLSAHLIDRETKQTTIVEFTLMEALEDIAGSEEAKQAIQERLDSLQS